MDGADVLSAHEQSDIVALGQYLERHIQANWQSVLQARHAKLLDAYERVGELAYGAYMEFLLRPLRRQIQQAGLRLEQHFPGDFEISREWGAEDDRQRWMWSTISTAEGRPLGTLVIKVHHDHTQFRIPRPLEVLALSEVGKDAVVAALAACSPDFATAREASIEIAEYLERLNPATTANSSEPT